MGKTEAELQQELSDLLAEQAFLDEVIPVSQRLLKKLKAIQAAYEVNGDPALMEQVQGILDTVAFKAEAAQQERDIATLHELEAFLDENFID